MAFASCQRIVFVIGKYTDIFLGGEILCLGWNSIVRIFLGERNFLGGVNFPMEILHLEVLQNSYTNFFFIVLLYLY